MDRVDYTLQLFVLDPAPFGTGPYGDRLDVARFLAPATTVLALVQTLARLFGDWIRSSWFRRARGHVIVIGDGLAPTELAKRLVRGLELPLRQRLFSGRNRVVLVGSGLPPEHARRHGVAYVGSSSVSCATVRALAIGATTVGCAASHASATALTAVRCAEAISSSAASARIPRSSRYWTPRRRADSARRRQAGYCP